MCRGAVLHLASTLISLLPVMDFLEELYISSRGVAVDQADRAPTPPPPLPTTPLFCPEDAARGHRHSSGSRQPRIKYLLFHVLGLLGGRFEPLHDVTAGDTGGLCPVNLLSVPSCREHAKINIYILYLCTLNSLRTNLFIIRTSFFVLRTKSNRHITTVKFCSCYEEICL